MYFIFCPDYVNRYITSVLYPITLSEEEKAKDKSWELTPIVLNLD